MSGIQHVSASSGLSAAGVCGVGIVVPDAALARRWFEEVLGFECAGTSDEGLRTVRLVLPADRDGCYLELREYTDALWTVAPENVGAPNCLGLRHLAFWVDGELEACAAAVEERSRRLFDSPLHLTVKPYKQKKLAYFKGPAGLLLELMQDPEHGEVRPADPPRLARLDHVNIVVEDFEHAAASIAGLGFRLVPGKEGRLAGDWIDELTGLQGVDAYYAAFEAELGPTVEIIRYNSPDMIEDPGIQQADAVGIRELLFRGGAEAEAGEAAAGPQGTRWLRTTGR